METLYTVSQVAKETGVTIKTLHYYQKINLLLPTKIGENGYRYYSENDINTHFRQFYGIFTRGYKRTFTKR